VLTLVADTFPMQEFHISFNVVNPPDPQPFQATYLQVHVDGLNAFVGLLDKCWSLFLLVKIPTCSNA
jgi:hypothetical protein